VAEKGNCGDYHSQQPLALNRYVSVRVWREYPHVSRFLGLSAAFATFTIFAIKGVSLILRNAIMVRSFTVSCCCG
jgi:hypothetical protein